MLKTHNFSVSKHFRGKKKDSCMCPPTRKLDFTHLSIRIDYTSSPQSTQAALRVAEPVLTTKIKNLLTKYFSLFEQVSNKSFGIRK